MGRSKSSRPVKRQRQENIVVVAAASAAAGAASSDSDQQAAAIDALKKIPQEVIELAAADATRMTVAGWPELKLTVEAPQKGGSSIASSNIPSWLRGLGPSTKIDDKDLSSLKQLHETILTSVPKEKLSSWSGSPHDPRRRAFGILPGTLGHTLLCKRNKSSSNSSTSDCSNSNNGYDNVLDISRPWREHEIMSSEMNSNYVKSETSNDGEDEDGESERERNEKALVFIQSDQLPTDIKASIEGVCALFRRFLTEQQQQQQHHQPGQNMTVTSNVASVEPPPSLSDLAGFLHFRNLIAAQPNLHNGRELLPMHVDHPKKDGFGVIICTIAIAGSAKILLQASTTSNPDGGKAESVADDDESSSLLSVTMQLDPGQAYMLADRARDACIHGVLADQDSSNRMSLNLRFGIHDIDCNIDVDGDGHCDKEDIDVEKNQNDGKNESSRNIRPARLPIVSSRQVLKYWE